jgi:GntR family transcriptional regulator
VTRAHQTRRTTRNNAEETAPESSWLSIITLDKRSGIPIRVQLAERIRLLVREGQLRSGDPMPTIRMLAGELGINENTVARVYHDLRDKGILLLERGLGTTVAQTSAPPVLQAAFRMIETRVVELIRLARQSGFRAAELLQLIETRWQESKKPRGAVDGSHDLPVAG